MAKEFQKEYDRLSKELTEQKQKQEFAYYNIDNISNMILKPYFKGKIEQEAQKYYTIGSDEYNKYVQTEVETTNEWIQVYFSHRVKLEITRPTSKNPDDPDWQILQNDLAFCNKQFPEIHENLNNQVTNYISATQQITQLETELQELMYGSQETEKPVVDTATEMSNIEEKAQKQVEQVTQTPTSEGHVYPIALVKSWTNEMKSYSDQLKGYLEKLKKLNLNKIDRMWLKKQVLKFVAWLKKKLKGVKEKVVKGLKAMMQPIKKALTLIEPILTLPVDPLAILGWAGKVVSIFTEPYTKVVQFISDFMTYTPPLMASAATLTTTVATAPVIINNKVGELEGEAGKIVAAEIYNAVDGLIFEAPKLGDVT